MADTEVLTNEAVVRAWFDALARGAVDEWDAITDPDMSMHVVFMPGSTGPVIGRNANRAIVGEFWKAWKSFAFHNVEINPTQDPDLFFTTAESKAETVWGAPYANVYIFKTRLRGGRIAEHSEYFNALPVIEAFKDHLPA